MSAVRKTFVEAVVLGVAGLILAAGANSVRDSGSLRWTKNYFDRGLGKVSAKPFLDAAATGSGKGSQVAEGAASSGSEHLGHSYQRTSFEEVAEVFSDPGTEMGANIFLDARNDDLYAAGHIPGALQCDHYRLEEYIADILHGVYEAEKVIIYCSGGDCEDSIFLCSDLLDLDVSYGSIYLYTGGWEEWVAKKMPVETGCKE